MNGLEAIELMKQGKMVSTEMKDGEVNITKIENNKVYWLFEYELEDNEWREEDSFDFTLDYEEYVEPKALTGWERVKGYERYCVIKTKQQISSCLEGGDECDRGLYEEANYFSTIEKAEEINFKQTLFRKLQRFSDENGGDKIDWNDEDQSKYRIRYKHRLDELFADCAGYSQDFGQVYFVSKEVANKAIDLFHDDLIKYFTGDWSEKNE